MIYEREFEKIWLGKNGIDFTFIKICLNCKKQKEPKYQTSRKQEIINADGHKEDHFYLIYFCSKKCYEIYCIKE